MCFSKSQDYPPLFNNLHRPHQVSDINSNVWNAKYDYLDLEDIKNLNPYKKNLFIMQWNIHSAVSKKTELIDILNTCMRQKSRINVVMLCKTYLNDIKEKQFKFKDYMLYSNHQQLCKGGGVSILVKR